MSVSLKKLGQILSPFLLLLFVLAPIWLYEQMTSHDDVDTGSGV